MAALVIVRGRAAGLTIDAHAFGTATWLSCVEVPDDVGFNRAFDVDARESGVAAALVDHARAKGRHARLEVSVDSLGEAQRAELAALGLARLWDLCALRRELDVLPDAATGMVVVRTVLETDAETFGDLAIRAYGASPPGFPSVDPGVEARKWIAFARLGHARCFVAEIQGVPCAVGMYLRVGDTALVDGAATVMERRGHGCQTALIAHRLHAAKSEGVREAITRTASAVSQRNLEGAGMRVCGRWEVWG